MTEQALLKECPFCGCKAFSDGFGDDPVFWVECRNCYTSIVRTTKVEAIAVWNTRAYDGELEGLMRFKSYLEQKLAKLRAEIDANKNEHEGTYSFDKDMLFKAEAYEIEELLK
jgi:hypothetical protein